MRRDAQNQPQSAEQLAKSLPADAWRDVAWREGVDKTLRSRFAGVRVRPAHRDYWRSQPYPEEWLLVEWPLGESAPTKYWLSTLPADADLGGIKALLVRGQEDGWWQFEVGCVTDAWRDA